MNSRRLMAIPPKWTARLARSPYSMTLVAAGASGFLTLIQSGERPERYGRSRRFATMPSSRICSGVPEDCMPSVAARWPRGVLLRGRLCQLGDAFRIHLVPLSLID